MCNCNFYKDKYGAIWLEEYNIFSSEVVHYSSRNENYAAYITAGHQSKIYLSKEIKKSMGIKLVLKVKFK